ncbi:AAA family ATPase [Azospirillum halopraeferens]|uniref:AAA family ATPase n=1 Tax=Azospirillum halopraeferens TaxID=34010 RepID=UPI0004240448|nr:ATP-binding protein [Azospirillum halopraeferens]
MATAQQLLGLIRSHARGDEERFHALTLQLAASEDRKGHKKLAGELRNLAEETLAKSQATIGLRTPPTKRPTPIVAPRGELAGLMSAAYPKTRLSHMILDAGTAGQLKRVVEEHRRRWQLQEHGLHPRHRLLLIGPPGSGKTMTASALAGELGLPLFTVLLHGVITRFMGESAAKLRLVFDAIADTRGVYLFDELDALAAQRGNENDVGEARRLLNSFLQFLDEDHGESLIVATTNHQGLLDKAIFRRFHLLLEYRLPDRALIADTVRARLANFDLKGLDWTVVSEAGEGLSTAEIMRAAEDAAREAVLDGHTTPDTQQVVTALHNRKSALRFL